MPRITPSAPTNRPLQRRLILDGAVAVIEREGSDALSMRRLGATLGVEEMCLHHLTPLERSLGVRVGNGFSPAAALGIHGAMAREDFPILADRAHKLATLDADAGYEQGLRVLLAGLGEVEALELEAGRGARRDPRPADCR